MKGLRKDPIVEEIRKIRAKISKEMETNPERHKARMADIRERYKDQLVSFPPRRIEGWVEVKAKKKSP